MPSVIDAPHTEYLRGHDLGHLTTVAPDGAPQNKPVGYRFDPERQTIEIGGYEMEQSAKFRNLALHPAVAFTVDDRPDPGAGADGVRFVELRGDAERIEVDDPMYAGSSRWIIRLRPRRLVSYNVAGPGSFTADLAARPSPARPDGGLPGPADERARRAVERLVAELQAGLDTGDAELYNRHFADDVMWGSPYGGTVDGGYDALHAIHEQLHARGVAAHSRYEIVRVIAAAPDVALAHVRRRALRDDGFSEMALYVLVRRDGEWWLAAGQNTIIDPTHGEL